MNNPIILICSEHEETREHLKLMLCDHYNLILVDSTEQALDILAKAPSVKIFIQGQDLDGISLIESDFPSVACIALTTSRLTPKEVKAIKGIEHIGRPFKAEKILETVGKILSTAHPSRTAR